MVNIYKYGFWLFLLSTFTLYNVWHLTKTRCEQDIILHKEINDKRIASLFISNVMFREETKDVSGINIVTNDKKNDLLKGNIIAILLSDFKCDRCQLNELKRLMALEKRIFGNKIKVIGITTKDKIGILLAQKKIIHVDFPLYYIKDSVFYNRLAFAKGFPQILFISKGIVLSAFKPIIKDDYFSIKYYKKLVPFIQNYF